MSATELRDKLTSGGGATDNLSKKARQELEIKAKKEASASIQYKSRYAEALKAIEEREGEHIVNQNTVHAKLSNAFSFLGEVVSKEEFREAMCLTTVSRRMNEVFNLQIPEIMDVVDTELNREEFIDMKVSCMLDLCRLKRS